MDTYDERGRLAGAAGNRPDVWQLARRALACRCPNCGRGRLFTGYVTPVSACAVCGEPLGHIRADDGPAWLTILIVGHIVVAAILAVEPYVDWPQWVSSVVWLGLALVLVLIVLRPAKALFIGILWRSGAPGSEGAAPRTP